ncbi:DUF2490 domain-containing protein [Elizabethkingia argentiflava]|uniref:DUF2490 domain-containing protein n=1 Tax=Elizabethkingia argenteiflava TaxID=2681556 RepID=A0A845Q009_9FLAO|nr:DUF2490 domain-containing protein [Elizabethkingia argenteiflava]NAW51948.1 DUF2490 domain-containing protein [Elizabethkingia argenteiflava]
MKKNLRLILIILGIFYSIVSKGQSRDNYNMWFQYLLAAKVSDKSTLTALSQYRSFDLAYDTRLFLINSYLDYKVSENLKPGIGAMFLILKSYKPDDTKKVRYEKRPFQQLTIDQSLGKISLSNRLRIEERFLNNPDDFIVRMRYLISIKIPFNIKDTKDKFYGIFKNEIRMNIVKDQPFDSNRITAGIGIKTGKNSALEVAFINQLEIKKTSNYGYIGFRNNFDWRKKETQNHP